MSQGGIDENLSGRGLLIAGRWCQGEAPIPVLDKYTGEQVAEVREAGPEHVRIAVDSCVKAASGTPPPAWRRAEVLTKAAELLAARAEVGTRNYVAETGFTGADAGVELNRAGHILRLCASEAISLTGETIPVEATPGSEDRLAFTMRVPVGVVCAITPFNAPLTAVAHKVGPALAAGNAVILKPAETTPLSALLFAEVLLEAGLDPAYLQVVIGPGDTVGRALTGDDRIRYFTFTGSTAVGLEIKRRSAIAKTHLELGSNSATIVMDDADLGAVVDLVARAGFRKAGQVCTSVQRLLVHADASTELEARLAERVGSLEVGDPRKAETDVGPLISGAAAERAARWVEEAVADGAALLVGGERDGAVLAPTLLSEVSLQTRLMREEAFAPIVSIRRVESLGEAVEIANETPYGLQAGIFTGNLDAALAAARGLRVGGVIVNDTSSYHPDAMPYGGVKSSGFGVEGPHYAVEDMTDPRTVVLRPAGG